jgi:hypothetical protein
MSDRNASLLVVVLLVMSTLFLALGPAAAEDRAAGDWTQDSNGLPTSGTYFGVAFGDVNNDGRLDVVGASDGDGLRVFLGDGAGGWSAVSNHPATDGGYGDVVVADYDADGNADIIAGSPGNGDGNPKGMHIWKGDGKGGFTERTSGSGLPTNGNWRGVAAGDVDGDGNLDIAGTNGYGTSEGIHVYLGDGASKFEDQSTGLPGNQNRDSNVVLADFDNDGDLDVAAGGGAGVDVYLVKKGPLGNLLWTQSSVGLTDSRMSGITGADWNKDGLVDLVVSAYNAGGGVGVYAYENTQNAAVWTGSSDGLPDDGDYIENAVGDLDGDGNPDVAIAGSYGGEYGIHVYYGDGDGSWSESSPGFSDNVQYVGVDVGDYNGDGTLDIVAGKRSRGGGIEVWRNPSSTVPPPLPEIDITFPAGGESLTGGERRRGHHHVDGARGQFPKRPGKGRDLGRRLPDGDPQRPGLRGGQHRAHRLLYVPPGRRHRGVHLLDGHRHLRRGHGRGVLRRRLDIGTRQPCPLRPVLVRHPADLRDLWPGGGLPVHRHRGHSRHRRQSAWEWDGGCAFLLLHHRERSGAHATHRPVHHPRA